MKNKEKIFMNIFRKENNNNKNYSNKITFNLNDLLNNKNNFQYEEIYVKFLNMFNDFIKFFFSYKKILDNNENSNENKKNSNENKENCDFIEKKTEKIKNLEKEAEIIKFLLENLL